MNRRQSKLVEGTVGNRPCERALNQILLSINDAYLTRRVMSRYYRFKKDLKKVQSYDDREFRRYLLLLIKKDHFGKLEQTQDLFPKDAYTHLLCCMTAEYRETIKK